MYKPNNRSNRGNSSKGFGGNRRFQFRKKYCKICAEKKSDEIDYKNVKLLRRFISKRGKILPRRITGSCASHQRLLVREIKKAREIALLPYRLH